jgi:hypothetical protein
VGHDASQAATQRGPALIRPDLVCLPSARNRARDLPGYFVSVESFGDAIVAIETGTHEDLVAAGGDYARMFALHASAFDDPPLRAGT